MTKRALILWGGWDGHEPQAVAQVFQGILEEGGYSVEVSDSQDALTDGEALKTLDVIVPIWTMGTIEKELVVNVSEAVASGVGLAGCHGGMCDAFRDNVLWQFMTGANWVAHPGGDGVDYKVNITQPNHQLVSGIVDFKVKSEQYYLHIDPANDVLASTTFPTVPWYHSPNGPVEMPVAWTRSWGHGRVYYNALGHQANVISQGPALEMIKRGTLWAADGKKLAVGKTTDQWQNEFNNY